MHLIKKCNVDYEPIEFCENSHLSFSFYFVFNLLIRTFKIMSKLQEPARSKRKIAVNKLKRKKFLKTPYKKKNAASFSSFFAQYWYQWCAKTLLPHYRYSQQCAITLLPHYWYQQCTIGQFLYCKVAQLSLLTEGNALSILHKKYIGVAIFFNI